MSWLVGKLWGSILINTVGIGPPLLSFFSLVVGLCLGWLVGFWGSILINTVGIGPLLLSFVSMIVGLCLG